MLLVDCIASSHIYPYIIAASETIPGQVEISLIWRSAVMPKEAERNRAIESFRQALSDVLDWDTAQYNNGKVLMHT